MLSYQHAYHAGSNADVLKHTIWAMLMQALTAKPKPLHVYETHSGRGLYPLDAPEMQKLQEYKTGLARLFPAHAYESQNPYLQAVAALNPPHKLAIIPGSPAVATHLLRAEDHLHLAEAHPLEFSHLTKNLGGRQGIHLHHADGHSHIPALIKSGQRTAVLIDPSFEVKEEYLATAQTVQSILRKNPQAVVMVWYPVLEKKLYQSLINALKDLNVQATWLAQYTWAKAGEDTGMVGSGHIILNLPYKLEDTLAATLKTLTPILKQTSNQLTTTFLHPRQ